MGCSPHREGYWEIVAILFEIYGLSLLPLDSPIQSAAAKDVRERVAVGRPPIPRFRRRNWENRWVLWPATLQAQASPIAKPPPLDRRA